MTDFVNRLLGRPALPAIRPLIPTMFEPAGLTPTNEPLPLGVFTTAATQSERQAPPREGAAGQWAAPATRAPTAIGALAAVVPAVVARESVLSVQTHHEHVRGAVVGSVDTPPHFPIASEPPTAPAAAPRRPRSAPLAAAPRRQRGAAPAAPQPISSTVGPPSSPVGAPIPWVPPAAVSARRERRREPDVHISIGRVEITAENSPGRQQQRASARRAPQLSLDDYLRGRGADGR
jgi:hypothetical protein